MKIAIPKETAPGETRVALIPSLIPSLKRGKHEVFVEKGAGERASFSEKEYADAGATIVDDANALYRSAEVILKVQSPRQYPAAGKNEAELLPEGSAYIGFFAPLASPEIVDIFLKRKILSFSMEYVPRITRAQSMDALSSMSTISGYKAVLMAADHLPKMFPLLMTAAGTVAPAGVFILGAGVAGLQAIATARRLGGKVEAFDPRPAVKEQVKSLGANFIEMEVPEDIETAGGYAKEQSPAFIKKEMEAIAARLPKTDVVITTAQVFGKRAPLLMTEEMVKLMRPGSVIVDLAAQQGGNCELTEAGKTVVRHGVTIIGAVDVPASIPVHASQMYAKNITNLFLHLYQKESKTPDFEDEIVKGACITRGGEIYNAAIKKTFEEGGNKQ